MGSSAITASPRASAVQVTEDELVVQLTDGRRLAAPLAWFPRLLHASEAQRNQWELLGGGEGIRWNEIDEDLSVSGLLRGTPAPSGQDLEAMRLRIGDGQGT
ncbi:MAG: DUF2442 domain-containing protein [Acidobacteriota bacterium]|nr:DUF2442 domain-containing protein [Acidobacteriota bacterium]